MSDQNTDELSITDSPEQHDSCTYRKSLTKRISSASNLISANDKSFAMNASKINALRQSVNRHNDNVSKILLTSKESLDKKTQIESAFRACKEAFIELSVAYLKPRLHSTQNADASRKRANYAKRIRSSQIMSRGECLH